MNTLVLPAARGAVRRWRDCLAPKEHGSWSLAFEPIALGLLAAPTLPGAALGLTLAAGFFARRPLRLLSLEKRSERRRAAWEALAACAALAVVAGASAVALGGVAWLHWLLPLAILAAAFAWCDLRGAGRDEAAEVAGSAAFAVAPAAFAALAGWAPLACAALALVAVGRAVPSVLCVRAFLRAAKGGARRDAPALIASVAAAVVAGGLVALRVAPIFALAAMVAFAARAFALLVVVRPAWRARTVGMIEAALGVVFVVGLALASRG